MHPLKIEKRKSHNHFFVIISCLLVLIGILSFALLKNAAKLKQLESSRHKLYSLGIELKESSEDLTKYCRSYVLTGDTIWEQKYWEALDIRNGKKPRSDGRNIALLDSLLKLGIAKDEFEKLSLAEKNSNNLVWTERVAFNAMKGSFADASKKFTKKTKPDSLFARRILFDNKYQADKESIMQPIADFRSMLDKRTSLEIKSQNSINKILLTLILIVILIISALSFYAIVVLRRKIIKQIGELRESNKVIKENEKSLTKQNEEIRVLLDNLKETNTVLLELNATKDKFFSIIAHDLKNPFNLLLNFNNLLVEGSDEYSPKEIKQLAQMMHESVKQTYKLLENLLAWARVQTGNIEPRFLNLKPSYLINETNQICEPLALNKGIELKVVLNSDDFIFADEEMLKTILRNLTTNAIKYTYPNGTVKIETQRIDNNILFTISDTGIGIETHYIEKIFDISSKLSRTGTDGELGTGLGLILCKEFVEKNNGRIWVESEVGKGSNFKFTIPLSID